MNALPRTAALAASLVLLGCASQQQQPSASAAAPGETKAAAIEVCMPPGERAYLARLRCADGATPTSRRVGSFGSRNEPPKDQTKAQEELALQRLLTRAPLEPGETDYHIVDGYELSCGAAKQIVYLDMYHCHQPAPTVAPKGLTLPQT